MASVSKTNVKTKYYLLCATFFKRSFLTFLFVWFPATQVITSFFFKSSYLDSNLDDAVWELKASIFWYIMFFLCSRFFWLFSCLLCIEYWVWSIGAYIHRYISFLSFKQLLLNRILDFELKKGKKNIVNIQVSLLEGINKS